jgi:transcriptional regulator with XRE-family HTH domain
MTLESLRIFAATRLRERREHCDLSQFALGEKVGVDQTTIQRWETGKTWPSPEDFAKLEVALGIRLSELLDRNVDIAPPVPSNKQVLDVINTALMERDMLRNLEQQKVLPQRGSPQWNEMLRAGLKNRSHIESLAESKQESPSNLDRRILKAFSQLDDNVKERILSTAEAAARIQKKPTNKKKNA